VFPVVLFSMPPVIQYCEGALPYMNKKFFYINKIHHQKNCIKDNTSKVVSLILGANGKQQKKRKKILFLFSKITIFFLQSVSKLTFLYIGA
jgi:hypothetical protein